MSEAVKCTQRPPTGRELRCGKWEGCVHFVDGTLPLLSTKKQTEVGSVLLLKTEVRRNHGTSVST